MASFADDAFEDVEEFECAPTIPSSAVELEVPVEKKDASSAKPTPVSETATSISQPIPAPSAPTTATTISTTKEPEAKDARSHPPASAPAPTPSPVVAPVTIPLAAPAENVVINTSKSIASIKSAGITRLSRTGSIPVDCIRVRFTPVKMWVRNGAEFADSDDSRSHGWKRHDDGPHSLFFQNGVDVLEGSRSKRGFAATRALIKFNDSLDQFGVEIEVPNEQVKVLKITKTLGTTVKSQAIRSSIESLQNRLKGLQICGQQRLKEVQGIVELYGALKAQITSRLTTMEEKASQKPERLAKIEGEVVEKLTTELRDIQAW
ncbi:hypothetical protein HDU97_006695 [Phlyctochytrium planicorne]|nr:hypothetical protein HDU97_006695 [Phlyctochytrium planicorne]